VGQTDEQHGVGPRNSDRAAANVSHEGADAVNNRVPPPSLFTWGLS